jgi:putative FmdB family regulatory protein
MPIYEYRCNACGFEQERLQKMSDAPLTQCPSCGQDSLRKLVSAAGFQLKGSGWYATDFRNGAKGGKADKPEGGSKDDAGKEPAKKDDTKKDGNAGEGSKGEATAAAACGAGGCPACQ